MRYLFLNVLLIMSFISHSQSLKKPPYLKGGDTVAIVAPSGVLNNRFDEVKRAKSLLVSWGLHVEMGKYVFAKDNHFAGTDDQRCEDLQNALDNPSIKAIWCARGGYGTVRILDQLDVTQFKQNPKWLIGYSDITALHSFFHNAGVETLHAIMCTSLVQKHKDLTEKSVQSLKNALFGKSLKYDFKSSFSNKTGMVEGKLVGGNLTLLHALLGSSTSINTKDKILFIEEIGEYKYHIDRMIQSLKRAGYFEQCKGLVIGDMSKLRKNTTPWGSSIEQLILDALSDYDFPIAFGMPAGHEPLNLSMIMGREVQLKVENNNSQLIFLNK